MPYSDRSSVLEPYDKTLDQQTLGLRRRKKTNKETNDAYDIPNMINLITQCYHLLNEEDDFSQKDEEQTQTLTQAQKEENSKEENSAVTLSSQSKKKYFGFVSPIEQIVDAIAYNFHENEKRWVARSLRHVLATSVFSRVLNLLPTASADSYPITDYNILRMPENCGELDAIPALHGMVTQECHSFDLVIKGQKYLSGNIFKGLGSWDTLPPSLSQGNICKDIFHRCLNYTTITNKLKEMAEGDEGRFIFFPFLKRRVHDYVALTENCVLGLEITGFSTYAYQIFFESKTRGINFEKCKTKMLAEFAEKLDEELRSARQSIAASEAAKQAAVESRNLGLGLGLGLGLSILLGSSYLARRYYLKKSAIKKEQALLLQECNTLNKKRKDTQYAVLWFARYCLALNKTNAISVDLNRLSKTKSFTADLNSSAMPDGVIQKIIDFVTIDPNKEFSFKNQQAKAPGSATIALLPMGTQALNTNALNGKETSKGSAMTKKESLKDEEGDQLQSQDVPFEVGKASTNFSVKVLTRAYELDKERRRKSLEKGEKEVQKQMQQMQQESLSLVPGNVILHLP